MGLIRGSAVFILTTALFLALFLGNFFLTFNLSLEYNNIEPYIQNITNELVEETEMTNMLTNQYAAMEVFCISYQSFDFQIEDITINIPCKTIKTGQSEVIDYSLKQLIPQLYYKKYNCEFFTCLKENNQQLVLLSETAKKYWNSKFLLMLTISTIIFILLFLFVQEKHSAFIITGIVLVFTAIPFKKIDWLFSFATDFLPLKIIHAFFTKANDVFLIIAIAGVIFVIIGFGFSLFKWQTKIINFLNKILKREPKEAQEETTEPKEEEKKFSKNDIKSLVKQEIEKIKPKGKKKKGKKKSKQ